MESEIALDLGCKPCAKVYLAILGRGGVSWQNQIIRDTRLSRNTVKRHLDRLLALSLVAHGVVGYRIVREIDSARPFGFQEVLLPKETLAKVRNLILRRPDLGFVDREEEFIREAIRQFLHSNRTSPEGFGQQL